jgi:hypothetical protein
MNALNAKKDLNLIKKDAIPLAVIFMVFVNFVMNMTV